MSTYTMWSSSDRWLCPSCGKSKDAKAKMCRTCWHAYHRRNIPDKQTLINCMSSVGWNYRAAGRFYSVSDDAVRKWCKDYMIGPFAVEVKT